MRFQNSILKGIFPVLIVCFVAASCNKDKFTTKPQLKFKKASTYNVAYGGIFTITLEFTDKEGDLTDSIWVEGISPSCALSYAKAPYKVPEYPTKTNDQGEFEITYINSVFLNGYATWAGPQCQRPDTTTFRFWIRDKAGNTSDTISTDKPIIIQNR